MGSSRARFSPEFKEQAVREVIERSRPIVDVARELGIVPQTLGNWVAAFRQDHDPQGEVLTEEEKKEVRELKARVRDLEEQVRFLEKASAFFARRVP